MLPSADLKLPCSWVLLVRLAFPSESFLAFPPALGASRRHHTGSCGFGAGRGGGWASSALRDAQQRFLRTRQFFRSLNPLLSAASSCPRLLSAWNRARRLRQLAARARCLAAPRRCTSNSAFENQARADVPGWGKRWICSSEFTRFHPLQKHRIQQPMLRSLC